MIPIYKPHIIKDSIYKAIDSEWISNYGEFINLSKKKICEIFNIKHCILMNNGTAATHCLFIALKYKYPNIDTIYISNNSFIAVYNCALMEYDESNINIMKMNGINIDLSDDYILSLNKNSALVIIHNLGYIVDVIKIKKLRPDLIILEDNCEGIFGKYYDKFSGTESLCSSLSFYANKTITTGEGGCFLTNDDNIYEYINSLYSHGMTNKRYIHDKIAYNYRMTNLQAALLYDQLNNYENILLLKKNIFNKYKLLLNDLYNDKLIDFINDDINTTNSYWMFSFIIKNLNYNDFEIYMKNNNIEVRPFFYDVNEHLHLKNIISFYKSDYNNNGIMLPSYPDLNEEQLIHITNTIKNYIYDIKYNIINKDNLFLLEKFILLNNNPFFRYFKNRDIKHIDKHIITIIITNYYNDIIGYSHIDYENDIYWIGICIIDKFQNKGYGKKLLKYIIDYAINNNINKLTLTVDINNINAIKLYYKFNFKISYIYESFYKMELILNNNNVILPISIGESFDKLSILDIKLKYINDDRKNDVKYEYDLLNNLLKNYNNDLLKFYYKLLIDINTNIWNLQNDFRLSNKYNLCMDIINENDRRFKIKEKINLLFNSKIKEQKGYNKKKAFFLSHLGLGDTINLIGAIRYLSSIYDNIVIVCKHQYLNNIKLLFRDDNSIDFYPVNNDKEISVNFGKINYEQFDNIVKDYDKVFLSGIHVKIDNVNNLDISNVPFCFYNDLKLEHSIFWKYFYIESTNKSKELFNNIKNYNIIFIHNMTSGGILFNIDTILNKLNINSNDYLIVNPNINYYNISNPKYSIADNLINHFIIDYIDIMINASYNIVSDSAFFCLGINLNIKTNDNYYLSRDNNHSYDYFWHSKYGYNDYNKKIFKHLKN
jgi:perosamine synthetase